MNTKALVGGIVIVAVIGGLIWYASAYPASNGSYTATSTTPGTNTPPVKTAGIPSVVTSSKNVPTDTTVMLTGTIVPNGAFTSYWYEYGTTMNLGAKTQTQLIGSGYASTNAPGYITGLAKDTTYYYALVAENEFGRVVGAQYSFQTTHTNPPPVVGAAPTAKTLAANEISRTAAHLNGQVNPNKAMTGYWFEYGKTPNLGNTTAFVSAGDGSSNVTAFIALADLDPDTTYYFRLNAQNQFSTVNGSILNFKTNGPAAGAAPSVATESATNLKTTSSTLRGTVNPNGTPTTYWFEYSTDSLLGSVLLQSTDRITLGADTSKKSVSADISNLTSKTTYYFRIVAQNSFGTIRGNNMTFKTK